MNMTTPEEHSGLLENPSTQMDSFGIISNTSQSTSSSQPTGSINSIMNFIYPSYQSSQIGNSNQFY